MSSLSAAKRAFRRRRGGGEPDTDPATAVTESRLRLCRPWFLWKEMEGAEGAATEAEGTAAEVLMTVIVS